MMRVPPSPPPPPRHTRRTSPAATTAPPSATPPPPRTRRDHAPLLDAWRGAAAVALSAVLALSPPLSPPPSAASEAGTTAGAADAADAPLAAQIAPCASSAPACVSTASFLAPAQYMPPWGYAPGSRAAAWSLLLHELDARGAAVDAADEARGFLRARVPYGSGGGRSYDLLTVVLRPDGAVLFRSEAPPGAPRLPPPPFCVSRGCISGASNRARLAELRDALGFQELETSEEKRWVQILLH